MPIATTPADLGALIRERRVALGLSQLELARRAGVSRQWIVGVEAGKDRAEVGRLFRVLNTLDLAVRVDPRPQDTLDAILARARGSGS
ncbi:MAG: helix-turn-helix transcriptional regulator [Myxococcales bacterium]|nr:helix-turn-helix transcriptional regulator [Myxococcales bacterium]